MWEGQSMRTAISATDDKPEALVHSQFGRCDYFLIYDDSSDLVKAVKNAYADRETGAGIGCAQDLLNEGVNAVIAGRFGPKAYEVLRRGGAAMYLSPSGCSVQQVYEKYLAKELRQMEIQMF
jgi:predicted Fe-Mo cluster-binding NifX family protein